MPEKVLRAFMEPWEAKSLVEVIEEGFEHGMIYWFHWPYDGPRFLSSREDYEPVAVIKGGVKLAARPHFTLTWTDEVLRIGGAPAIVFLTSWHHPVIRGSDVEFVLKTFGRFFVEADYRPRRGEVPRWFRDAGMGVDFRDYAVEVCRDPLNKGFDAISWALADFIEVAEKVDEAIGLLESGDLEKSLEVCRWIIAEVKGKIFGEVLAGLVEPYVRHVDEHGLPPSDEARKEFMDYLKKDLGYVKIALNALLGRE